MFTFEEAESDDLWDEESINMAELTEVVKQLLDGRLPEVDATPPEMLKALDAMGLPWLIHLFSVLWRTGTTSVQTRKVVLIL